MEPGGRLADEEPGHMTPEFVVQIMRDMFMVAFWLSAPLLAIGFVAGNVVSLFQIVTSLYDFRLHAIPPPLAFLGGIVVLLPSMLHKKIEYSTSILWEPGRYAG